VIWCLLLCVVVNHVFWVCWLVVVHYFILKVIFIYMYLYISYRLGINMRIVSQTLQMSLWFRLDSHSQPRLGPQIFISIRLGWTGANNLLIFQLVLPTHSLKMFAPQSHRIYIVVPGCLLLILYVFYSLICFKYACGLCTINKLLELVHFEEAFGLIAMSCGTIRGCCPKRWSASRRVGHFQHNLV